MGKGDWIPVSSYEKALALVQDVPDEAPLDQGMALFSTHTNLTAVLGLLQDAIDSDDVDGIDERMEMLEILVQRHRRGHHPGQGMPRRQFEGTVKSGKGMIQDPVRIETERFHLWIYPNSPHLHQVRIEIEPK